MKVRYFSIIFSLLLLSVFSAYSQDNAPFIKVKIKDRVYSFESADTEDKRRLGLMFRDMLDEDSGMFFVFDREDYLKFHMENTFIPLDIAFVDSAFTVVDIQNMRPENNISTISKAKAQYALEVNQGFLKKTGLQIGEKIELLGNQFISGKQ